MRRLLFTAVFTCFFIAPASAGERLDFEQARDIALRKVPGTIVDTERSLHNGAIVFEFDIRQESGAVMSIGIDSSTGEVLELKIDKAGTGAVLPEPSISAEDARTTAIHYIESHASGLRAVEILKADYKIEDRRLAHVFHARRGISTYRVVVDATSGKVLSMKDER